jgi:hypothetical protein
LVGQTEGAGGPQAFQSLCVPDDGYLAEIIQASLRLFHASLRWPDYPRTLEEDYDRAVNLVSRGNVCPPLGKVRWLFLLCSDPARIAWVGAADPQIAGSLAGHDVAGLGERGLVGRTEFLLVLFGGYLTHAGDFALAEAYYQLLIGLGFVAEGYLGLADVQHALANWREELREYEDRGVYPKGLPIPAASGQDPIGTLENYSLGQAIAFYEQAVRAAPAEVSFYRLHLARARIDQGDLEGARADLLAAAAAADPNPFVGILLNLVERLIAQTAMSLGDFMPAPELRERYHAILVAPLVTTETLAAVSRSEPVVLCEETRLQGAYAAVVDGQIVEKPLDLHYPAHQGLHLALARDLGLGLKLAGEQHLIVDGQRAGLQRLKMFVRPVLMTGEDHAVVGLPRYEQVVRSDRPLTPMPGAGFNYYHWIIDSMGAAALLERKLGPEAVDFIVNRPLHSWQREVLELVAPQLRLQIMQGPTEPRVLVNAFHLPPPARLNVPHPEAVRTLRERMSRHGPPRNGKRVWVGRSRTRGRTTVNEAAIQDYLERQGFEMFDSGDKTVAEQIAYFSDVDVLVSPAGAALTNLLFCPSQTRVVILTAAFHHHETYTALAAILGQRCWVCLAPSETRPNPYAQWSVFDQTVSLQDVQAAVEEACRA